MTLRLLFLSLGIILTGYLPVLPPLIPSVFVFVATLIFSIFLRRLINHLIPMLMFTTGVFFGIVSGHLYLSNQLIDSLAERDLIVEGRIVNLPQENKDRQLFTMNVTRAYLPYNSLNSFDNFPGKVILSSYGDLRVKTGELWRLTVKLKKPRGFVNPGGFDYQVSLLRRGIGATGYIRDGKNQILQSQSSFSFDVLRFKLREWLIQKSDSPQKSILVALLVGDTSLVDKDQWAEMLKTGTNHLIAISGLHLGFFAIVGFFIGNLLGRFVQLGWHKCPSVIIGYTFSVVLTLSYSVIAGLNIPTVRTLIMLIVVQLMLLARRNFRGRDTLLVALVLVLLYDPLAAYDIGFWLSFGAVGMLIFCFSGRMSLAKHSRGKINYIFHIIIFIKSQWVMFIGLLIPLTILVHTSSLLAAPANFIAIPVITFFVVPCLILSAVSHFSFGVGEDLFLHCAEIGMSFVHQWLHYLLAAGGDRFNPLLSINTWAICLAVLSVFIILLPRGLSNIWIGIGGLIFAFVIPQKKLPDLQLLVFDVGQGTAILIRTPNHQLIYDTGPMYTENFDAGSGIIVPYLQSQGLRSLDAVVISHNDQDHSGGLSGLLASTSTSHLWLGEPDRYHDRSNSSTTENCHMQKPWQWDGVKFHFLTWPGLANAKANNHSCVLSVEYGEYKILLTGDIEKEVERLLVEQQSLTPTDILLAPHHGSHTSSTQEFVAQVQPHYIVYSVGFHNKHGHPHQDVQARYQNTGANPANTAYGGALEFVWNNGLYELTEYRRKNQRYWFDMDVK